MVAAQHGEERSGSAEEQDEEHVEGSRQSGGDAPAAGSIGEREAVASGDDELFDDADD